MQIGYEYLKQKQENDRKIKKITQHNHLENFQAW